MLAVAIGITMIAVVVIWQDDRLRFASGCKEDRSGSSDHGGTFDHYNSGYLYDSGIFPGS